MPHQDVPELQGRTDKLDFSEYPFLGKFINKELEGLSTGKFSLRDSLQDTKSVLTVAEWLINPAKIPESLSQNSTFLTRGFEQVMNLESTLRGAETGGAWERHSASKKISSLIRGITDFVQGADAESDGKLTREKAKTYEAPELAAAERSTSAWDRHRAARGIPEPDTEKALDTPSKGGWPRLTR